MEQDKMANNQQKLITLFAIFVLFSTFIVVFVQLPNAEAASSGNIAPINDGNWYTDGPWSGPIPNGGSLLNVFTDTSTTYNGAPTWRVEPPSGSIVNTGVDHGSVNGVTPGTPITMFCYIKTTGSGSYPYQGAHIGFDYYRYANNIWERICGIASPMEAAAGIGWSPDPSVSYTAPDENSYFIKWGTDWVLESYTFTVPAYCISDGNGGVNNPAAGTHVVPTACIPWCQVWSGGNTVYTSYFSGFSFIENPSSPIPTPTPTPTVPGSTPTPTPIPTLTPTPTPTPTLGPYPSTTPPPPPPVSGSNFLITQAPFVLNFTTGQSFAVQSLNPASTITFTVTSGTLNGTGTVSASGAGGTFQIIPTTSGTLLVTTSGAPASVYIGGNYVNNVPYSFSPGG